MWTGELGAALLDLALPVVCGSCGRPGEACCAGCLTEAWGWCYPGGPRRVRPDPCPSGLPPVLAAGVNDGALRRLLHAYKDEDRRDLREPLADLLAPVLRSALAAVQPAPPALVVVPVPSSAAARRRRGDRPLEDLVALTTRRVPGAECARLLRARASPADQAGLGHRGRAANLHGTMRVADCGSDGLSARALVGDLPVVVADDLLTTGATLVEATRALTAGGAEVLGACVVAATSRRS